ncbi:MAG: hypothetical protein PHX18_03565 [Candidatus Gastranaerophilales bacterium]|nr:hypothetical protein [Candidatus Gastranaerophilales bacterium]
MLHGIEKFNSPPVKAKSINIRRDNHINFCGSNTKLINQLVKDEIIQNKLAKFFFNVKEKANENFNILVNALGTALVAPIFIAWNPISKENQDTKTYSALRQPISAVLAVLTQIGINTQANKYLDKLAHHGKLGPAFDLSMNPPDKVLISSMKNSLKGKTKEAAATILAAKKTELKNKQITKIVKGLRAQGYKGEFIMKAAENAIESKITQNITNLKRLKIFTGMFVTLAIMPFTCWVLNWIYPRFMDFFFPSISRGKKGGNKKC